MYQKSLGANYQKAMLIGFGCLIYNLFANNAHLLYYFHKMPQKLVEWGLNVILNKTEAVFKNTNSRLH